MTTRDIKIRLGVEGGPDVRRTLDEVGKAGQSAFDRTKEAADRAGAATDRQTERNRRLAQAAREAEAQARAQSNINSLLGVRETPAGGARASAAAFETELARREQLQAARQEQAARNAQTNINRLLGIREVPTSSARASASAFEDQFRREAETRAETLRTIASRQTAQSRATDFRSALDQRLGVRSDFGSLGRAEDIAAYGAELDRVRARYVPLAAASQAYRRELTEIAEAARKGALNETERAAAVRRTKDAFADQVREARAAAPGGSGRRLRNDEVTNLMYQGGDIAAQLGSGSSLSMIAMQQGPQIAQIFAGPGGASVKGAFAQAGEAVSAFVARVGIAGAAIGGLTLAAGVSLAALVSYRGGQVELERTLSGVGRTSGATAAQINALADAQSRAGGISRSAAREAAATYATTGRVDASLLGNALGATTGFSRFLNVEQKEGAEQLATALADVSRGATELSQRYGLLNDAQAESIRRMDAQGNRLGAQRALLAAVTENTRGLAEETRGWSRITEGISNLWDRLGSGISGVVFGGPLDEEFAKARQRLASAQTAAEINPLAFNSKDIANAQRDFDRLKALVDARNDLIERAQRAQRSAEIGGIIRTLLPEQQELQRLQDKVELVRRAIADPVKFGLDRRQLDDTVLAFERLSRLAKTMAEDVERFGSTAVAAANRAAEFGLRTASMNPVERSAAEIREKYERELRERGVDPNGRTSAQVEAEYAWRLRSTEDPFERQRLADERDRRLQEARELEGRRRERDIQLEALRQRTEQSATRSTRLPEGIVQSIIGAESNGRNNARNPLSTATGAGQFIDETWLRLFKDRFAERAAGMSDADILARRTNRADSEAMVEAYAQQNARALERSRFPVNATNLYMGHHFGEGGMLAMLRADPSRMARDVLGASAARANPRTIGDLTVGQSIDAVRNSLARNDPSVRASREQVEVMRSQLGLTEQSAAGAARLERVQELLNQARAKGTDLGRAFVTAQDLISASSSKLTAEQVAERRAMLETADAYGRVTAAAVEFRGRRELTFEREQLGRSDIDASAFARARSYGYGNLQDEGAQAFIAQSRLNSELRFTKDLGREAFGGLMSDMRRGVDFADALSNSFGRMGDRLADLALDQVFSGLFAGEGKQGGGWITAAIASAKSSLGFSGGGFTGPGGKYDVAGFVHRGEVVFSQADVARHGGVCAVEAMRRSCGLRGYADGGIVGGDAFLMPRDVARGMGGPPPPVVFAPNIITPPGFEARTREVPDGRGGRRPEVYFAEVTARGVSSREGQQSMAATYGIRQRPVTR